MEAQLVGISADEGFIYDHYSDGKVVKGMRRGSNKPSVLVSRKTLAKTMGEEVENLEQNSAHLEKRLRRLENRAAVKPEKIQERPAVDQRPVADEDERWVEVMLSLGGEGKEGVDISAARERIEERVIDEKLTSVEAKRKCQSDSEDERWVSEMLRLGGQTEG